MSSVSDLNDLKHDNEFLQERQQYETLFNGFQLNIFQR